MLASRVLGGFAGLDDKSLTSLLFSAGNSTPRKVAAHPQKSARLSARRTARSLLPPPRHGADDGKAHARRPLSKVAEADHAPDPPARASRLHRNPQGGIARCLRRPRHRARTSRGSGTRAANMRRKSPRALNKNVHAVAGKQCATWVGIRTAGWTRRRWYLLESTR